MDKKSNITNKTKKVVLSWCAKEYCYELVYDIPQSLVDFERYILSLRQDGKEEFEEAINDSIKHSFLQQKYAQEEIFEIARKYDIKATDISIRVEDREND